MTKEDKAEKYASETWSDTPMSGKPRNEYLYRLSSKELAKSAYLAGYNEAQALAHEEILDLKSSRDAWKHLHEQAFSMATEISNRLGDAEVVIADMEQFIKGVHSNASYDANKGWCAKDRERFDWYRKYAAKNLTALKEYREVK